MTQLLAPHQPPGSQPRARWQRMRAPATTISGLALATIALHVRDPHEPGSWGLCPSAVMGFYCPGCGGLRAVNDLTNGDVAGALSSNLVVTLAIPFAVVGLLVWAADRWRGRHRTVPWETLRPAVLALVTVLAVFTVTRNLELGAWLAP